MEMTEVAKRRSDQSKNATGREMSKIKCPKKLAFFSLLHVSSWSPLCSFCTPKIHIWMTFKTGHSASPLGWETDHTLHTGMLLNVWSEIGYTTQQKFTFPTRPSYCFLCLNVSCSVRQTWLQPAPRFHGTQSKKGTEGPQYTVSDQGQMGNCFGLKYFSVLNWSCLVRLSQPRRSEGEVCHRFPIQQTDNIQIQNIYVCDPGLVCRIVVFFFFLWLVWCHIVTCNLGYHTLCI